MMMKQSLKSMIPYGIIHLLLFYLLPVFIKDTGSAMGILLVGIPIGCLLTGIFYGCRHSFHLGYALVVMLLFYPSIYIFYNESAQIYTVIYGAIALLGDLAGCGLFYLTRKKEN